MAFTENCHSPLRMIFQSCRGRISHLPVGRYIRTVLYRRISLPLRHYGSVKLEGVDTAERARMFTNIEAYFPVKHAEGAGPRTQLDFHRFPYKEAHHGQLGEVTDVDTLPSTLCSW